MGLFSRLFGKEPRFRYRVCKTSEVKFEDFVEQTCECISSGVYPLTVYHCDQSLATICERLVTRGVAYEILANFDPVDLRDAAALRQRADTMIFRSSVLPAMSRHEQPLRRKTGQPFQVNLFDVSRTPQGDRHVANIVQWLSVPVELTAFLAMDDPLMMMYGADNVQQLVRYFEPDDVLTHPSLSRSIVGAQRKVAKTERSRAVDAK